MLGEVVEAWAERENFTYRKTYEVSCGVSTAHVVILDGPMKGRVVLLRMEDLPRVEEVPDGRPAEG